MTIWQQLHSILSAGEPAMLVSVVSATGSTPRGAGACMVLTQDGKSIGTIGGGNVEYDAQRRGRALLQTGGNDLQSFRFIQGEAASLGMVCGGDLTVHFHTLTPVDLPNLQGLEQTDATSFLCRQLDGSAVVDMKITTQPEWFAVPVVEVRRVLVFGGGHVSQALVPMLSMAGYTSVVYDDRAEFADKTLFSGVHDVILGDFNTICNRIAVKSTDAVIVMTRGHQADYEVLTQTMDKGCWYVGCIGSKTKLAVCRGRMLEAGFSPTLLDTLHAPIGLPLGGRTPAQIAIAVVAELIAVEHGTRALFG
ncbi:xanthine dehydrogenase accessory protein XdhC [Bengtsoniella intestinalis]|uniref:xanthine dehydrogenase accessory protein XdhC n=1 Tax=Bengtsoniella intestinalis TaxID=3073143 RepID=UPI00391F271E